jgi:hypothetical protein
MDTLIDFLNWAWARHHNPLSWYIRPLFILPFCYFAHRKSVRGMVWTVVAVTSSMFWFPAPATPDSTAVEFLEMERRWIAGPLTLAQTILTVLIPVWFIALATAIRRRLWGAAALVIVAGTALKVGWSFYMGGASAWIIVPPVAVGNGIVALVLIYAYWRTRNRRVGSTYGPP